MKKQNKALVLSSLVCLLSAPAAMASVTVVGVGNYGLPAETLSGSAVGGFSSTFGLGGGVLFDLPIGPRVQFEIGGLYIQEKLTADSSAFGYTAGTSTAFSFNKFEIPVALKFMFAHHFFIDGGAYLANVIGSTTTTQGGVSTTANFTDAFQNPLSFGLIGGVGAHVHLGGMVSLMLEGRYHLQLSNSWNASATAIDSTASLNYNELQMYAGLTFGGGGGGLGGRR